MGRGGLSWLALVVVIGLLGARPAPADDADARFAVALATAKADPAGADYVALRRLFAATSAYRPDERRPLEVGSVEQEVKNGEWAAGLLAIDTLMEGRWVDAEAHAYAADACSRLHLSDRARMHAAFLRGLSDAILARGDGRGFATAWPVLTIREEDALLAAFDLAPVARARVEQGGRWFDVVSARPEGGGDESKVYFDADMMEAARRRRIVGAGRGD